jgi:hypothetical protein
MATVQAQGAFRLSGALHRSLPNARTRDSRAGRQRRNRGMPGRTDSSSGFRGRSCMSTGASLSGVGTSASASSFRHPWRGSCSSTTSSGRTRATEPRDGHRPRSSGAPSVNNVTRRSDVSTPFRYWTIWSIAALRHWEISLTSRQDSPEVRQNTGPRMEHAPIVSRTRIKKNTHPPAPTRPSQPRLCSRRGRHRPRLKTRRGLGIWSPVALSRSSKTMILSAFRTLQQTVSLTNGPRLSYVGRLLTNYCYPCCARSVP